MPTRRSGIAFVSLLESGRWGASEYLWSETALRLAQDGHAIVACTHGWSDRPEPLSRLVKNNITLIERFPPPGSRLRDFIANLSQTEGPNVMQAKAISQVVKHQPALLLISCTWPTDHNLPDWCKSLRKARIPYAVLIHTHAGHNWPLGLQATQLSHDLNEAAAVYFVSEDNRSLLVNQIELAIAHTAVVRNPLSVERDYQPPWPDDAITRFACVGRLDPRQKGQDILLECLRDDRWKTRRFTLSIYGDGPAWDRLHQMAATLPPGVVNFHGQISNPATIWETHHLLIFPSRYEGLGLVVAEAQLCGRPVVITDCAARELVIDGQTGFIAAAPTVRAVQTALDLAWEQRARWPEMGRSAREHMLALLPVDPAADFCRTLLALLGS